MKLWRGCMTQKKNNTSSDLKITGLCPWSPNLNISLKILLKLNPSVNLKIKPKMGRMQCYALASTLELSMNVKNVMQNLQIK